MRKNYKEILVNIMPAVIFYLIYKYISYLWAVISGFGIGIAIYATEFIKKKRISSFSWLGISGLVCQTIISLIAENPNIYFLYPVISNLIYAGIFGISLFLKTDAVSYLAKDMFNNENDYISAKPALRKLTFVWFIFHLLKSIIKLLGIINWSFEALYIVSFVLGYPVTTLLLWVSFKYPQRYYKRIV